VTYAMHELSVALSLLDVAAEEARRQGEVRVCAIHLRLGPLSGVLKDALLSAFALAREGTALEAAELVVEDVPVRGLCATCNAEAPVASLQEMCCARCGTPLAEIVSGREMDIVALEIQR
jgi:hydrogenase nickel incorporation protein HypA/HybF